MENITYNGFFTLQWHITHRCNLRCSHCYQDDYSAFSSRESLEAVLNQYSRLLEEYGFKGYLNITGGEPLAHPDLFWLLEEARRRQMTTAVLTNGTMVGLREARRMRASGVQFVQISLDGVPKTHDAIRGKVVKATIDAMDPGQRNMGSVMKAVMAKLKGKADGKLINQIVRKLLA